MTVRIRKVILNFFLVKYFQYFKIQFHDSLVKRFSVQMSKGEGDKRKTSRRNKVCKFVWSKRVHSLLFV